MYRRLLSFLLVFLISFSLTGCLPGDTKLFDIYIMPGGSGPEIFLDNLPTADQIPRSGSVETPEEPAQTREILFGEQLHPLRYSESASNDCYVYTDSGNVLTCGFSPYGGTLRMLAANGWLPPETASTMNEDDYLDWIKEQVSVYYTENWEQYRVSCTTEIRDSFYGKDSVHEEKGFSTPFDSYESVDAYTFTFTKYLGEYATTDVIRAYIRPETGYVSLEFSEHTFDNAPDVKIDQELIQASVFRYLSKAIIEGQYSCTQHTSVKPTLGYINGHLVYLCTIEIDVLTLNNIDKLENKLTYQPVAILLQ